MIVMTKTWHELCRCVSIQRPSAGIPASAERDGTSQRAKSDSVVKHSAQEQDYSDPRRRNSAARAVCQRCRPHLVVKVKEHLTL